VDDAEAGDGDAAPQRPLEHPIPQISLSETIAVCDQCAQTRDLGVERTVVKDDADLLAKEAAAPRVVVAAGERDRDSGFDELRERREHAEVSAVDDGAVLEPEVEEVARQEEAAGAFPDVLEKLDERALGFFRYATEMHVRCDVLRFRHGARS
jgi:hypothetical protein